MRFLIFTTLFLTVFLLLNFYISKRLVDKLDIKNSIKLYFNLFLVLNFMGVVGYMIARYNPAVPNWLFFLLSFPIGIIFLLFCTALIYDLSRVSANKLPISKNRRKFFKKTLDISSLALALGITGKAIHDASVIELEKVEIKLKDLKKPYKIVQLSDIHIGGIINQKFIADMVNRVNPLNPDLVVITGDVVDVSLEYAKPALNELKKLNPKYGTYFIEDYHSYRKAFI